MNLSAPGMVTLLGRMMPRLRGSKILCFIISLLSRERYAPERDTLRWKEGAAQFNRGQLESRTPFSKRIAPSFKLVCGANEFNQALSWFDSLVGIFPSYWK